MVSEMSGPGHSAARFLEGRAGSGPTRLASAQGTKHGVNPLVSASVWGVSARDTTQSRFLG